MTVTTGALALDTSARPPIPADARPRLTLADSAALFGSAFAPAQVAVENLTPWGAVTVRFGVAALVMLPFCLCAPAPSDDPVSERHRRDLLTAGLVAGAINTIGFIVISFALERTTASNAAFLSSLSVVIVPVAAAMVAAQAKVEASSAALILVLVPVVGAGVAFVVLGERLGLVGALGALLILGAVVVPEVLPARRAAVVVPATPVP